MIRVASQLTFCSPQEILQRTAVEQNEYGEITRLYKLDDRNVETAQTQFFDGIISAEIISVKEHLSELDKLYTDYLYVDLSNELPTEIKPSEKPLLLDFGTQSIEKINKQFTRLAPALIAFSIFDIMAACCYFPALAIQKPATLSAKRKTQLLLWENSDLVNKRITERTRIRKII